MEKKELKSAIDKMVKRANYYSRKAWEAMEKDWDEVERGYAGQILGIAEAMSYLGYFLDKEGREGYKYVFFKARKSKDAMDAWDDYEY